jgi:hypothetical protein
MNRTAALVTAAALTASPGFAAEQQPAADNAPGSQTQEMQGKVGTTADQKAKAERPESRGASGDSYPTTTGSGGSQQNSMPQQNTTPPQTKGDSPRDGTK